MKVFLYGPKESGFLDIAPGTSLQTEKLSEIFDEDLSTGEFSIPTDFPWTERNKRLFGFAERLENFSTRNTEFTCDVYDADGELVMPSAKVTILEKSGFFSYRRGKFSASISGTAGLYGSAIKNKKLADLALGGKITWNGMSCREFATDVMNGTIVDYPYLGFAPVARENFFVKDRPDYDGEFLVKDTVNCVVTAGGAWEFGRPSSGDPSVPAGAGTAEYRDFRTIPFFTLQYVLRKCFEDFGYKVSGAVVDDPAFAAVYIDNNFALEVYNAANNDTTREILPKNHVPDVSIGEFLKAVLGLLCAYPVFVSGTEVLLKYRKQNLLNRVPYSINGICSDEFTSSYENEDKASGYKLAYTWDSNDDYQSDRVKDISDKTLVATVAAYFHLATLNIGRQLTTDDIAYVEADNMYYIVADATQTPVLWDVYSEALNDYTEGDGERSTEFAISTLCTYVEQDPDTKLYMRTDKVGCRQKGSYRNNKGVQVSNPFGLRIFYITRNDAGVPVSHNHNRDIANNKLVPYSLSLNGKEGLVQALHLEWQALRSRGEIVKTSVFVNRKTLAELFASYCYEHQGVLFVPYKFERVIPMENLMKVELMIL